jgi:hypothetical protein
MLFLACLGAALRIWLIYFYNRRYIWPNEEAKQEYLRDLALRENLRFAETLKAANVSGDRIIDILKDGNTLNWSVSRDENGDVGRENDNTERYVNLSEKLCEIIFNTEDCRYFLDIFMFAGEYAKNVERELHLFVHYITTMLLKKCLDEDSVVIRQSCGGRELGPLLRDRSVRCKDLLPARFKFETRNDVSLFVSAVINEFFIEGLNIDTLKTRIRSPLIALGNRKINDLCFT